MNNTMNHSKSPSIEMDAFIYDMTYYPKTRYHNLSCPATHERWTMT
jgi:hypothetical protein